MVITPEVLPKDSPTELFALCIIASNGEPKSKTVVGNNWDATKNPYEAQGRKKSSLEYQSETCKSNSQKRTQKQPPPHPPNLWLLVKKKDSMYYKLITYQQQQRLAHFILPHCAHCENKSFYLIQDKYNIATIQHNF